MTGLSMWTYGVVGMRDRFEYPREEVWVGGGEWRADLDNDGRD